MELKIDDERGREIKIKREGSRKRVSIRKSKEHDSRVRMRYLREGK